METQGPMTAHAGMQDSVLATPQRAGMLDEVIQTVRKLNARQMELTACLGDYCQRINGYNPLADLGQEKNVAAPTAPGLMSELEQALLDTNTQLSMLQAVVDKLGEL